jgi:hypothetical protein
MFAFVFWQPQELGRFDVQRIGKPPYNLEARIEDARFKLTQIAPAYLGIIGEIILRQPALIAQTAQISCENVAQIHAGMFNPLARYMHLDILNKMMHDRGRRGDLNSDLGADDRAARAKECVIPVER